MVQDFSHQQYLNDNGPQKNKTFPPPPPPVMKQVKPGWLFFWLTTFSRPFSGRRGVFLVVEKGCYKKWQKQRFAKHKQKTPKKNIVLHNPSCFFGVVMMYRANHPRKKTGTFIAKHVFSGGVFLPILATYQESGTKSDPMDGLLFSTSDGCK